MLGRGDFPDFAGARTAVIFSDSARPTTVVGAMPPAKRAKRGQPEPFTLRYFALNAKGLGPALVAEYSGLPWKGNQGAEFDSSKDWKALKPDTPFGQMPLLTTADGLHIAQTTAIINYIGKQAKTEGDGTDYIMSQMCLAEGEDLYNLLVKLNPTILKPQKCPRAEYDAMWETTIPAHLAHLEKLSAGEHKHKFSSTGATTGEVCVLRMYFESRLSTRAPLTAHGVAACSNLSCASSTCGQSSTRWPW